MRSRLNVILWILQCVLAAVFLFAGAMKLFVPAADLQKMSSLPVPFLRFVATCEVLGALGLILPGLLRIAVALTTLAAACLVVIMIGATTVTLQSAPASQAVLPAVTGILLCFLAYGRWRLSPLHSRD